MPSSEAPWIWCVHKPAARGGGVFLRPVSQPDRRQPAASPARRDVGGDRPGNERARRRGGLPEQQRHQRQRSGGAARADGRRDPVLHADGRHPRHGRAGRRSPAGAVRLPLGRPRAPGDGRRAGRLPAGGNGRQGDRRLSGRRLRQRDAADRRHEAADRGARRSRRHPHAGPGRADGGRHVQGAWRGTDHHQQQRRSTRR